jgi:hypothetical protein
MPRGRVPGGSTANFSAHLIAAQLGMQCRMGTCSDPGLSFLSFFFHFFDPVFSVFWLLRASIRHGLGFPASENRLILLLLLAVPWHGCRSRGGGADEARHRVVGLRHRPRHE